MAEVSDASTAWIKLRFRRNQMREDRGVMSRTGPKSESAFACCIMQTRCLIIVGT